MRTFIPADRANIFYSVRETICEAWLAHGSRYCLFVTRIHRSRVLRVLPRPPERRYRGISRGLSALPGLPRCACLLGTQERSAEVLAGPRISSRLFSQRPPSRERRLRGMYMCAYRSAHLKCVHSFQGASANSDVSIFHERRSVATRASVYSLKREKKRGKKKDTEEEGKKKSPDRSPARLFISYYI